MSFDFSSERDADLHKSLETLIKFHNGIFRSEKQSKWFMSQLHSSYDLVKDEAEKNGITIIEDNKENVVVSVYGFTRWADYGSRSIRNWAKQYVLDKHGVVASFKLGFKASSDGKHQWVDKDKIKLVWKRTVEVAPKQEVSIVHAPASSFVGNEKDKISFKAKVTNIREFASAFSFGSILTLVSEEGNKFTWFSSKMITDLEKGDVVNMSGTVKSHRVYKDEKQTVLTRCKYVKSFTSVKEQV